MSWKQRIGVLGILAVCTAAGLQWVPGPRPTNPSIEPGRRLETHVAIPGNVAGILQKACRDCHTNETRWPWYSRIAPMSWAVAGDVNKARESLNFSEWGEQNGKSTGLAIGTLLAACANVQGGRMPLPRYTLLHPESRLSASEIQEFCAWTQVETKRLAQAQRERRKEIAARPAEASLVN